MPLSRKRSSTSSSHPKVNSPSAGSIAAQEKISIAITLQAANLKQHLPLYVLCVGCHEQKEIDRMRNGYHETSRRLNDLLLTWMEGQNQVVHQARKSVPSELPHPALQAAVKWIHDHSSERMLLSHVAKEAGYSVQHFHRLFVANFGITPQQYMLQLRLTRSLRLFKDYPSISVDQAADKLGMDTSYFIRMFKRTYGTTPKQYGLALSSQEGFR